MQTRATTEREIETRAIATGRGHKGKKTNTQETTTWETANREIDNTGGCNLRDYNERN